jgi:hypothetical protein
MEQGRLAACHAFGVDAKAVPELFPYGIYTIPEISMVGKPKRISPKPAFPTRSARRCYKEIARGQIIGDQTGLLKLIFHSRTRELLGVHIIGEQGGRADSHRPSGAHLRWQNRTISSKPSSTTPRWPNATRWRLSTGLIDWE